MRELKFKIITGFRKDQQYTIDADEVGKAYRLFMNPSERAIFKNGLAIIGESVRGIEPDYNATMNWNPGYTLGDEDWNQIRKEGVDRALRDILAMAKIELNSSKKLDNGSEYDMLTP